MSIEAEYLPLVIINLSPDDISLSKGEIMGFMQIQSLEISEIMTETSTEPSSVMYEDKVNEVLIDQKVKVERKFITSPADIEVHRKNELQDAEISDDHRQAFKDLCAEFDRYLFNRLQ